MRMIFSPRSHTESISDTLLHSVADPAQKCQQAASSTYTSSGTYSKNLLYHNNIVNCLQNAVLWNALEDMYGMKNAFL